jgi:trk system potassium uptake protein TrkH
MISNKDIVVVGYNLGRIVKNIGLLLLFPIPLAVVYMEWAVIPDFLMAASVSFSIGLMLQILFQTQEELKFRHAIVVSSLVYGLGAVLGGLPLWTSGSLNTVLDGTFDGMSAWSGTGLSMIPDIDHLSHAINFWRHFMQFIGGAGIVVFALALLSKSVSGSVRLYISEGREEKIFPSIAKTSQVIFGMCLLFLLIGSLMLSIAGVYEGMPVGEAVFDSVTVTMAAFGTGGFSPHSQSIGFYHSMIYEIFVIIICLFGATNFVLHFTVLTGNRSEIWKNVEILTFAMTVIVLSSIVMSFLMYVNAYSDQVSLFRRGFFQLVSAHSGAGLQTVNPMQMSREWPYLSLFATTVAMLLGGCACSTSAGIKAIRVGVIIRVFINEVKKIILPENAVVVSKYHHIHPVVITDRMARGALLVALAFVILFVLGSLITMFYGYSMIDSMFETASALGNTGLSVGITTYNMSPIIKLTQIFLMWAGRLEIIAVFVLLGIVYLGIRRVMYFSSGVYRIGEKTAERMIKTGQDKK